VRAWQVALDSDQNPSVKHLGHLMGHTRDVNTVRFSPSGMSNESKLATTPTLITVHPSKSTGRLCAGQLLASAGVGGEMYLWKPSTGVQKVFGSEETDPGWKTSAALRSAVSQNMHSHHDPVFCVHCLPSLQAQLLLWKSPWTSITHASGATQMMYKTWLGHLILLHSCLDQSRTSASSGM